jgi:hypothetical protein
MNIDMVAYGAYAEWSGDKGRLPDKATRARVIAQLADMPRFEAVLVAINVLERLDTLSDFEEHRREFLRALEDAAWTERTKLGGVS